MGDTNQIRPTNLLVSGTPYVDIRAMSPTVDISDGTVSAVAALAAAAAIGSPVLIPPGTYLIDSSCSCAASLIMSGGKFSVATGATLTLTGALDARPVQLFDGNGAVSFTGNASIPEVYPQWWGAKGDGVTDCTAAIQAAINTGAHIRIPLGTYCVHSTLTTVLGVVITSDGATLDSDVEGPVILISGITDAIRINGSLKIDCNDAALSVGVCMRALAADGSACTSNVIESLYVQNAVTALRLVSDGNQGVFYNRVEKIEAKDCDNAVLFETLSGGTYPRDVNANYIGMVTAQRGANGIVVDGGDGNTVEYAEVENCTGTAIDLKRAFSFFMNGGWLEGNTKNISIADYPDVRSVYIATSVDSSLDAADAKFAYTASNKRSVTINTGNFCKSFGRAQFDSRVDIGAFGTAANDQGNSADGDGRLRVSSRMDCFRHSSALPYFHIVGRAGTAGWIFMTDDSGVLIDLKKTRAEFNCPIALKNPLWNGDQLRLGDKYIYIDATGALRLNAGAPSADGQGAQILLGYRGATASVADGGTITHGVGAEPSGVLAVGSVAGEIVTVTAKSSTTFTVAIKKHDGDAGTTQTIYWSVWN